ncbi:MAG: globin domain-containing protein [Planctomycetota bacterium]|nr:globin domain-containing protein [Planctomycetota bacterium]
MSLNTTLLQSSLELVLENEQNLTLRFYEILFAKYPQVKPLFGRKSQAEQAKMLQEALVSVVDRLEDGEWVSSTLEAMGHTHVDYEVTEEMYPMVGDCLIQALKELSGDAWTAETEQAWSDAYGAISGIMIAGAHKRILSAAGYAPSAR